LAFTDGVHEVIVPLFASLVTTLFGLALTLTAIFLILLVLVQRGRGGGLAGALGGMGGSSAFGAKAGDIFTRITIGAASVWILLCIAAAKYSAPTGSRINVSVDNTVNSQTGDSATSPLGTEQQQQEGTRAAPNQGASGTESANSGKKSGQNDQASERGTENSPQTSSEAELPASPE
jgi:preprotein translocase subunit SecG